MPDETPKSSIVLYRTEDGRTRIQCRFEDETIWLTQAQIAELFQVTVPTVNEHLKGIFAEGELEHAPTVRTFRILPLDAAPTVEREIEHYRLEAILAVGYRVRSPRGTQFRYSGGRRPEQLHAPVIDVDGDLMVCLPAGSATPHGEGTPNQMNVHARRMVMPQRL